LLRELQQIDCSWPDSPHDEVEKALADRRGEIMKTLRHTRAVDLAGALAQLEFCAYYFTDNDAAIMAANNQPAIRNALASLRVIAAWLGPDPDLPPLVGPAVGEEEQP
jgi:hypothetical protein